MDASRHIRSTIALLALALACFVAFAFQFSTSLCATAYADDALPATEETPKDAAKRLIAALPADPDSITEADSEAIADAAAAYESLSADEQHELDTTDYKKDQSYGRWLESAQWGLLAQRAIDNSLAVIDGDYSAYATSTSSMGKSVSDRARSWSVVKLTATGGKATAIVRCDKESAFANMRVGGVDYKANVVNGVPEFTVPIVVNGTTTFTVDASSLADSIAYQITTTLPLDAASITAVAAASAKAASTLTADWSAYESASVSAVSAAANVLASAAVKQGVTAVELNVATKALDSAIASAVKKPVEQQTGDTTSAANTTSKTLKNKKTLTSSKAKKTGTASTPTVPALSNRNTTGTNTGVSGGASGGSANSDGEDDDEEPDDKDKSEASNSKEAVPSDGAATPTATPVASQSTATTGKASTVREVSVSEKPESGNTTISLVLVGGAAIALTLVGMVARTFLFARAKDVA